MSVNEDPVGAVRGSIRVNGERLPLVHGGITGLLARLGYSKDQQGIAVAVNGGVIRRSAWPETTLADGDTVEIVGAVQGG